MDWTGVERTNYVLDSLFSGGDFANLPTTPTDDARVELPVDVRANGASNADVWTGIVEYGHGYNGTTFRTGYEHRFNRLQLRGGGRYHQGTVGTDRRRRFQPVGRVRRRCRGVRDERQSRTETSRGNRGIAAAHAPQSMIALRTIRKIFRTS